MRNLINQFVELFDNFDEFKRRLDAYERVINTEEWKFVKDTLITIKGTIAMDMFSKRFTELPQAEKDVEQKTYYQINQLLDYLSNPKGWIRQRSKLKSTLYNLKDKVKPKSK